MTGPLNPEPGSNASLVVMPNTGAAPARSATEIASAQALERLASTGTALPSTAATQPRVAAGHPNGGEFARSAVRELPGPNGDESPEGGREVREAERPAPGTEGSPAPVNPAEGQPGEEGQEETPAEGTDPNEHGEVLRRLTVPALAEGEEEVNLEFEDPAVAQRLQGIVEQVATVSEREQAIMRDFDEIERVREAVLADPTGYAMSVLKDDPEAVEHLVLGLLTDPANWQRLSPRLQKMVTDANELRLVTAEQRAARAEYRDRANERIAEQRAVRENLGQLQTTVAAMIPETIAQAQAEVIFGDMMRDLKAYADAHDLVTIPIQHVPALLTRRLTALGIDPVEAAQRATKAASTRLPRGRSPLANRKAVPASTGKPAANNGRPPARKDGAAFKASDERRRAVSAIPAAGAGSPSTGSDLAPPRGKNGEVLSTEDTIKWHRARLAAGKRSYTPAAP